MWIWPALALAFFLGWRLALYIRDRSRSSSRSKVNSDYFKGLNFLLNEEPDKAIEVFIKALEVDSDTVELHLALGGLFRRKGQVDRATRLHQNLIARPNLTDDQRLQAVHELASDYYKAGLLDRAEDLFRELLESENYRRMAIKGLCRIYEQEKDWHMAISVLRRHKRKNDFQTRKQIAHYYCEQVELALDQNNTIAAADLLTKAEAEVEDLPRILLLRGNLKYAQGEFLEARKFWARARGQSPHLVEFSFINEVDSFQQQDAGPDLKEFLKSIDVLPKSEEAFSAWAEMMVQEFDLKLTMDRILEYSRSSDLSHSAADFISKQVSSGGLSTEEYKPLLTDLLQKAKDHKIEYTCGGCGYDTKSLYWFCPNCGRWDSFQ